MLERKARFAHDAAHVLDRQGDLRRLIRNYGRTQAEVYPVGPYRAALSANYGSDVDAPVPADERRHNPRYTGCFERGA